MTDIPALILAGGAARRMGGGDKTLLDLGGRTILAHIIVRLGPRPLAISANGDPARFAAFGLPVLDDGAFVDQGPLAGVLAGLDWAHGLGANELLTVPGDTPFLPIGLAVALAPAPACATRGGQVHPLAALWPVACRDTLRTVLSAPGRRDIRHFAEQLGVRRVDFGDGTWDPFMNINSPEDLAAARSILARRGQEGAV